ncbi:MAG TPA: BON domain-containing protein [Candidatus Binatia bacterium]|jgi:sporulation protein YlmC with PRC-barrel domain|nr:BON domain-containing protein [Candidatus Binatia bacterium]
MKSAPFIHLILLAFLSLRLGGQAEAGEAPATSPAPSPSVTEKSFENPSRQEPSRQLPAWSIEVGRLGLVKQTGLMLGKSVKDRKEKTVGKLKDLLLDLAGGEVVSALVSSSAANRITPVPAHSFAAVLIDKFIMKVDRQVFEAAPQLSQAAPLATLPRAGLDASFRHFGQDQSPRVAGPFHSAAALLGATLRAQDHQLLGQLKDIMVDVPAGRIVYLVVEPSDQLGSSGELYVVPPVAVEADASGGVVLKTGREHFLAGPHFSKDFWSDMAFPEMATAICKHYSVAPAGESHPIASFAAGGVSSPGSSPSPPGPSDEQITQAILAEIVRGGGDSGRLSIVVTTMKGHVTLRGTVKNEKQKKQVTEAAERVAGAANVEDRLEVWGKARTAQL